jgi:Fe-S oxidoreductase
MLSFSERIGFILFAVVMLSLAAFGFVQILRAIRRGSGAFPWRRYLREWKERLKTQIVNVGLNYPVFQNRPRVGLLHFMVFAGFSFYLLVNLADVVEGYFDGFTTLHQGGLFALFNLAADVLSVSVLVGMSALLIRRFIVKDKAFNIRENVLLNPRVRAGAIRRDSLIVGVFILVHVGSRWLGRGFALAGSGSGDWFEPTASVVANFLMALNLSPEVYEIGRHITWFLALGLILLFFPYFILSKHVHIFFAPINWLLYRERRLELAEPNDAGGVKQMQDLTWHSLLDSYACIMCNRCQDVCPAYAAGTPLSPSALEINKRYWLNENLFAFANGKPSPSLLDFAISKEAVWACTTCGACVEVCPVGNAPMVDIVEIRQRLISEGDTLDGNLQKALENLGKQGNSFGQSARARAKWTQGLNFKIKDARKEEVEYLWFVGDYASFDGRGQNLTRQVARVFQQAGLDFGILYEAEWNTGNDARRVGEEGLFEQLAEHNIAALDKAKFSRGIITTDPHTMNALRFEYAKLGKQYRVLHYTQVLNQLLDKGQLRLKRQLDYRVTYHDPCYLGRYNRVTQAPRELLQKLGVTLIEMPRHAFGSFCCGAGGGQLWRSELVQDARPSEIRIREALTVLDGSGLPRPTPLFIVACPKDVAMFSDAVKTSGNEDKLVVKDIIELVTEALQDEPRRSIQPRYYGAQVEVGAPPGRSLHESA